LPDAVSKRLAQNRHPCGTLVAPAGSGTLEESYEARTIKGDKVAAKTRPALTAPARGCENSVGAEECSQRGAYLVTRHSWHGDPLGPIEPLYVGGLTSDSPTFRRRVGDLTIRCAGLLSPNATRREKVVGHKQQRAEFAQEQSQTARRERPLESERGRPCNWAAVAGCIASRHLTVRATWTWKGCESNFDISQSGATAQRCCGTGM
jgi:hypothetical protein